MWTYLIKILESSATIPPSTSQQLTDLVMGLVKEVRELNQEVQELNKKVQTLKRRRSVPTTSDPQALTSSPNEKRRKTNTNAMIPPNEANIKDTSSPRPGLPNLLSEKGSITQKTTIDLIPKGPKNPPKTYEIHDMILIRYIRPRPTDHLEEKQVRMETAVVISLGK